MKVSIQIPVYNGLTFLKEALESIYRQKYKNFEVIVIDDGSKEDVTDILDEFPDVIYIKQEHRGVSAARNKALEVSSGELIAFLDSDDIWHEEKLKKQVAYLKSHPECMIVFSGTESFISVDMDKMDYRQREIFNAPMEKILASCCIRKSVYNKCGKYNEEMLYGEDTEFLARIAASGISLEHCIDDVLYLRRVHDKNMSLKHNKAGKEEYLKMLASAFRKARKIKEV